MELRFDGTRVPTVGRREGVRRGVGIRLDLDEDGEAGKLVLGGDQEGWQRSNVDSSYTTFQ